MCGVSTGRIGVPVADHGGFAAFRFRDFTAFYVARTFNALAVQMVDVAIGWLVYALTGSAFALGLVGLCIFLPNFLLALPAGQIAEYVSAQKDFGSLRFPIHICGCCFVHCRGDRNGERSLSLCADCGLWRVARLFGCGGWRDHSKSCAN